MSLNRVILCGNLTRDVELRFTPSGSAVGVFGIALNRKFKDGTGNYKDEVTFVDVTAWGKTAETIAQYFKKGSSILMEGRLKLDSWKDRQSGQNRSKLGVVLEEFSFVNDKKQDGNSHHSGAQRQSEATRTEPDGTRTVPEPQDDDEVPF